MAMVAYVCIGNQQIWSSYAPRSHVKISFIITILGYVSKGCFDKILESLGCSLFIQLCILVTQRSYISLFRMTFCDDLILNHFF